jgi:hypothetical protein
LPFVFSDSHRQGVPSAFETGDLISQPLDLSCRPLVCPDSFKDLSEHLLGAARLQARLRRGNGRNSFF